MPKLAFDAQITFIPTKNLVQTAKFYETIIVLPLVVDQGTCRIYQIAEGGYLGFCLSNSPPSIDERLILTLVCDNVDEWYTRLKDQGVVVEDPPRENATYRIYHFFARDPNGYRLEFQRFLDPFPPEVHPDIPPPAETLS